MGRLAAIVNLKYFKWSYLFKKIFFSTCVCTCECVCVRAHVYVCARAHSRVQATGQCQASPIIIFNLFFETGSLAEPGAHQFRGWPVSPKDLLVFASLVLELQVCAQSLSFLCLTQVLKVV